MTYRKRPVKVTITGFVGSGKTAIARVLRDVLERHNVRVEVTGHNGLDNDINSAVVPEELRMYDPLVVIREENLHRGPDQWAIADFDRRARELIAEAERAGLVLTIAEVPKQPLAMGNYELVPTLRLSHFNYRVLDYAKNAVDNGDFVNLWNVPVK